MEASFQTSKLSHQRKMSSSGSASSPPHSPNNGNDTESETEHELHVPPPRTAQQDRKRRWKEWKRLVKLMKDIGQDLIEDHPTLEDVMQNYLECAMDDVLAKGPTKRTKSGW